MHLKQRPRRLRSTTAIRALTQEYSVTVNDLIMPLFVMDSKGKEEIKTMPGQFRYGIEELVEKCKELSVLGINAVALFPVLAETSKDPLAKEAINEDGLYPNAIRRVKKELPNLLVMTDIALDPYSSDGHDGLVDPQTGKILNDETVEIFKTMAIIQAKAGADIIAPSDMMDGRIRSIRDALESSGYIDTLIMSYTTKYASSFYGPFRDALDSAPKAGDKKTYQMDYSINSDIQREILLDEKEGADILMVKPGLCYLDIVAKMSQLSKLPVAVYNVSAEYSMVKLGAENGLFDEKSIMLEILTAFKRAGANIIITYFAEDMAKLLKNH